MTERQIRKDEGGFTLLELLVTVGIMAAVAGTATLALQDTTARASAAAHVLMMDELNEGIMTYRVLRGNEYPNNFDSMMESSDGTAANAVVYRQVATTDVAAGTLPAGAGGVLNDIGITQLRYVNLGFTQNDGANSGTGPEDAAGLACNDPQGLINSRSNAVVSGNIFLSPGANGCGLSLAVADGLPVMYWSGGNERVLGSGAPEPVFGGTGTLTNGIDVALSATDSKILMAVGAGPSSNLFDAGELGGLTSVPVYRHVAQDEYNRFFILFHVATVVDDPANAGTNILRVVDQVNIAGVVDSAGDTKEEELGEWDGTRNTI